MWLLLFDGWLRWWSINRLRRESQLFDGASTWTIHDFRQTFFLGNWWYLISILSFWSPPPKLSFLFVLLLPTTEALNAVLVWCNLYWTYRFFKSGIWFPCMSVTPVKKNSNLHWWRVSGSIAGLCLGRPSMGTLTSISPKGIFCALANCYSTSISSCSPTINM